MGVINLLDIQTANLIAAGEVVERPSSAIKELCENSVDAGAKNIAVEIKNGGNTYIRVTDDGKGIADDDLPKTILRHATSKIRTGDDLDGITTLGFRGEALAAISSVSRMQILTKMETDKIGRTLVSNDEVGIVISDTGCPVGTTVIVKDLFYNVPARRKFLKRDATEAASVGSVVEKMALSHPEISFRFISDGETKFITPGDGKLISAIYATQGRAFGSTLDKVEYSDGEMILFGYVSRPDSPRGSRSAQNFFVNKRFVRSRTMMAALEEAFSSYIPRGKFPAGCLHISVNPMTVDVNVHPAKLEVKFSDERRIFDLIYYGVRSYLSAKDCERTVSQVIPPEAIELLGKPQAATPQESGGASDVELIFEKQKTAEPEARAYSEPRIAYRIPTEDKTILVMENETEEAARLRYEKAELVANGENKNASLGTEKAANPPEPTAEGVDEQKKQGDEEHAEGLLTLFGAQSDEPDAFTDDYKLIGEVYDAYAVVETKNGVYFIDKHAAHERILYEELRSRNKRLSQQLFEPIEVFASREELDALDQNKELLARYGFEYELKPDRAMLLAIPDALTQNASDVVSYFQMLAGKLVEGDTLSVEERTDSALFTIACKAALKAGIKNHIAHTEWVVRRVMNDEGVRYCPHGRPIMHKIPKKDIDKFFDR